MARENGEAKPYEQKVSEAADRLARRMGGQFVTDQRWQDVVRASQRDRAA